MTCGMVCEMAENIFHHDDGAVDDDAKVDCTDREQVGRFAAQHRDDNGKKQSDRNRGRDHERTAQVSQEYPLDQKNQRYAEKHIVQHGPHRDRYQIAAVVKGLDPHSRRKGTVTIDALNGCANTLDDIHGPLELLHQHDAEEDVILIVTPGDSQPGCETDLVIGDVGQHDGQAALLTHHDIVYVADRAEYADAAHVDRLLANRDGPPADIGIAGRDRVDDLRQSQAIGPHAVEIDFGLIFLGLAPHHHDVRDT